MSVYRYLNHSFGFCFIFISFGFDYLVLNFYSVSICLLFETSQFLLYLGFTTVVSVVILVFLNVCLSVVSFKTVRK